MDGNREDPNLTVHSIPQPRDAIGSPYRPRGRRTHNGPRAGRRGYHRAAFGDRQPADVIHGQDWTHAGEDVGYVPEANAENLISPRYAGGQHRRGTFERQWIPAASTTTTDINIAARSRQRPDRPPRGRRRPNIPLNHQETHFSHQDNTEDASCAAVEFPSEVNPLSEHNQNLNADRTNSATTTPKQLTHVRRFVRDKTRPSRDQPREQAQGDNATTSDDIQSGISESQLRTNTFECMICCDNIHRTNPIWYCVNCFNIFHLKCAIEWCNKSIKSRDEAIANAQYPQLGSASAATPTTSQPPVRAEGAAGNSSYHKERSQSVEWPCPACREVLHSRPGKYKCFCGKVIRPDFNRHLTPHSCGQLCGRKRPNTDCPHTCNNICHPGRCNPCSLTSRKSCHCGKLIKEVKCSTDIGSCGETCGKTLACGQHQCSRVCHDGACVRCDEVVVLECHCGEQTRTELCEELNRSSKKMSLNFSCDKICGKLLDCGKHHCVAKCHPGPDCPSCKLLSANIHSCPCGSTRIKRDILEARTSCLGPIPTCDNKCNRPLICGPDKSKHKCQKKCHTGTCPPCKLKSSLRCECGSSTRSLECALMFQKLDEGEGQVSFRQIKYSFRCESKCNQLKNCNRHRCQTKCCVADRDSASRLHVCEQPCNKKLACGLHSCPETCHPGQCGDCTNIGWEELRCHCGSSVMFPPIPCSAKPPVCHRVCRRAHNCGHPVRHECHDDTEKCAPCTVFVKRSCFCGAESKDSVYCYQSGYSCGRTCKKQLSCGQHTCKRVCHDNECETPNERAVIVCRQACPRPRFNCKHPCGVPCHGHAPCPHTDCRKPIEITCECGNRREQIECHKLTRDTDNSNKMAIMNQMYRSTNQDSGIIVDLSAHANRNHHATANSSKEAPTRKVLDCDEKCSLMKRNKALAEALEIAQPDLKPKSALAEDPLRLLKEAIAHDYKFASGAYGSLVKLIKSAKESEKRFIFMQFAPADKLRREVIHELAYHFNCTSESHDEEPLRHVVVRAYKNKSNVPDFTIEQLLPVADD